MRPAKSQEEVPLTGGRLTAGVVRVGDTVRRPSGVASPFTERLLTLFAERGFAGAPRFLGLDERGRVVLSFVPGVVHPKWRHFEDGQVQAAARLLRQLHDATRGSMLAGSAPVVCHNDPGPNNAVFVDGEPVAFIDFDSAAPGDPVLDLGYMAWSWCVASKPARHPVSGQGHQVKLLADAYGLEWSLRCELPDAMVERQRQNIAFWKCERDRYVEGESVSSLAEIDELIGWSQREMKFTVENKEVFTRALR